MDTYQVMTLNPDFTYTVVARDLDGPDAEQYAREWSDEKNVTTYMTLEGDDAGEYAVIVKAVVDYSKPMAGTWADVARIMAQDDDSGFDWDAWKDEMKEIN